MHGSVCICSTIQPCILNMPFIVASTGFLSGGGGGREEGMCLPLAFACPPLGYAENSVLHVNQFKPL